MKRVTITIIAISMIVLGSAIIVHGQNINIDTYNIEITTNDDSISVVESLTADTTSNDTIIFWIQEFPTDLKILVDGNEIEYYLAIIMGANTYLCNTSVLNITPDTVISATYKLDKNTNEFEKILQYNTSSLTITFDDKEIYTGTSLTSGSSIKVALQKETQGPTETVETIPTWAYIIIIILVIFLLASFILPSKKQKTPKKKETMAESEELLTTKKALLMEVLKDIEKQHRSEKISDDTYHKLKDQYKQEAVETMRLLEKSKVK